VFAADISLGELARGVKIPCTPIPHASTPLDDDDVVVVVTPLVACAQ
jgi:hypothetical protein